MTEQINLPAVPTDGELSKTFAGRPNWIAVAQMIDGVSGKDLFEAGELGTGALEGIQAAHIEIRNYLKRYDRKGGDYWQDRRGRQELIGESYAKERTAEINLWNDMMDRMVTVMADYAKARTSAEATARRQLEQQQREADERAKQAELINLNAQLEQAEKADDTFLMQDTNLAIEQVKSTPIIPTVVTNAQAAAAVGLPVMPRGLVSNKKPLYERTIVDSEKFIKWLAVNTGYIGVLFDKVTQKFSFTNIKHSPIQIDGVSMGQKSSITNRAK